MILAARPLALGLTLFLLALVGGILAALPLGEREPGTGARARAAQMLPGFEAPPWLSRGSMVEDPDVDLALLSGGRGLLAVARFPDYSRLSRIQLEERIHRLLPPPGPALERRLGHAVLRDAVLPALVTRYAGPQGRVVELLLPLEAGTTNPVVLLARSREPESLEAMLGEISVGGQGFAGRD